MFPPITTILPLFVIFRLDEKELGEAEVKGERWGTGIP